jgi:hypothetical protein
MAVLLIEPDSKAEGGRTRKRPPHLRPLAIPLRVPRQETRLQTGQRQTIRRIVRPRSLQAAHSHNLNLRPGEAAVAAQIARQVIAGEQTRERNSKETVLERGQLPRRMRRRNKRKMKAVHSGGEFSSIDAEGFDRPHMKLLAFVQFHRDGRACGPCRQERSAASPRTPRQLLHHLLQDQ